MKSVTAVAALAVAVVLAAVVDAGACPGVCQSNTLSCPGTYLSGLCPGGAGIQCCPEPTPACNGQCQDTSLPCGTGYTAGECPGSDAIECCTAPTPPPGMAGVDVSVPISAQQARCFASAGYAFGVARAWRSGGVFDPNAPGSLASFAAAGMAADVYLFPCVGQDPAGQVTAMLDGLQDAGAVWNRTWLDVEENPGSGCDWSTTDPAANCAYLTQLIAAVQGAGRDVGVYSSSRIWNLYFGGTESCTSVAQNGTVPLWYARYNNDATCNAFVPFAGWAQATWHQWEGDATVCGVDVDLNAACA